MTPAPLFSIVTPSYNQARFIEHNLRSVMAQDYPNVEQIVVDGNSTDGTLAIIQAYEKKYSLRWISEPDNGQSDAVNKGFRMSRGEFLGWINSDDMYFEKSTLSFVASVFQERPDVDVVYGDQVAVDENNRMYRVGRLFEWSYAKVRRGCSLSQPATFFRRKVVRANELNHLLEHAMDLDYWLRLGESYSFLHVPRVLAAFRIHGQAKSTVNRPDAHLEARKVLIAHGQRFALGYWLLHTFDDIPSAALRRAGGLYDCLTIPRRMGELAFTAPRTSPLRLALSQFWPLHRSPPFCRAPDPA